MSAARSIICALLLAPAAPAAAANEVMYPAPNAAVWAHVKSVLDSSKLGAEKLDDKKQIVVTKWKGYSTALFGEPNALVLDAQGVPRAVQFHVYVPVPLEPARVTVDAILEVRTPDGGAAWVYAQPAMAAWFLSRLTELVGAEPIPLAATAEERAAQARRMMPANVTSPCSVAVAPLVMTPAGVTPPQKLSDVRPLYPGGRLKASDAKVTLVAEMTEHGTLTNLRPAGATPLEESFLASARAAAGLWRYQPAMLNGCPARVPTMISVSFAMR